jgi:2-polyprenyl-3-methyl-5-hydroxy-6-metoxy-1,4-benzoquinol methylase
VDSLIKRFDSTFDEDLVLCERRGVAYQRNMKRGRIQYDAAYFEHFRSYAGSPVERALNAGRCEIVARHVPKGGRLIDIGIGSGAFIRAALEAGFDARGSDINPTAVEWLRKEDRFADNPEGFDAVTLWDTLEHIEDPELLFRNVSAGAKVFVAIPLMAELRQVRASKHYKPGEHLYYFTEQGFVDWMAFHGFRLLERSDHEIAAGREQIGAFAFCRDLPGYHEHVLAYRELHATRYYGGSATELHLDTAASLVRSIKPRSILDYGCGRSDLVAHFWLDGARRIGRYDPAIPALKVMPEGRFDLALCCDVMEHIPMRAVDRVLGEIRAKADTAFFTISTKLARAKLPDGRNAHVTLLTPSEWTRWIADHFGPVRMLSSKFEHEVIVIAGNKVADERKAA